MTTHLSIYVTSLEFFKFIILRDHFSRWRGAFYHWWTRRSIAYFLGIATVLWQPEKSMPFGIGSVIATLRFILCEITGCTVRLKYLAVINFTFTHLYHIMWLLIQGFWGAKLYQNRKAILEASQKIFYETEHKMKYGFDQTVLNTYIWPLAINDSV